MPLELIHVRFPLLPVSGMDGSSRSGPGRAPNEGRCGLKNRRISQSGGRRMRAHSVVLQGRQAVIRCPAMTRGPHCGAGRQNLTRTAASVTMVDEVPEGGRRQMRVSLRTKILAAL